ncbi:hypothetical protein [Alteromonas sp. a30]|uniref:hypothetical protein n=1 Tax=Alteromonas sp. a30 TaxID=2730917 RepID=UPI002280D965|nr:hypothetical protein [Alteromonas sp. a30]MCY7294215.1 hypothetical protein [Alteromonas sp. a30]
MAAHFINNQFILVYHDASYQAGKYSEFHFDNIVGMKADVGIGLYTEGTGNLANVKAATNPVEFTFRQSLKVSSGDTVQNYRRFKNDYKGRSTVDDVTSDVDPISGKGSIERSIYKWAEIINKGALDRNTVKVYVGNGDPSGTSYNFRPFIELTNGIPQKAIIKRNPYKGANVAELTFIADAMKVTDGFVGEEK